MKHSGFDMIGLIPSDWEIRRLKSWVDINEVSLAEDTDPAFEFLYIDIGSVGNGRLMSAPVNLEFRSSPSRARRIVTSGDSLVSMVRTYLKAVWFATSSEQPLVASTGFAVLSPRPGTDPKFLSYVLMSQPFANWVTASSVGVAYPAIPETLLATCPVAVPPLAKQTTISKFLDYATEKIEALVDASVRRIALLNECMKSLVQNAVTGKFDVRSGKPYETYRETDIRWLGSIPDHWNECRLRNVVEFRVSNVDKKSKDGEEMVRLCNYVDVYYNDRIHSDLNFMEATASEREIARFSLRSGDVLITKDSEIWNDIGVPALVESVPSDVICGYHLAILRPRHESISGDFLYEVLCSPILASQFYVKANGVTRYGLSHAAMKSLLIPVPSLREQAVISRYLRAKHRTTQELIKHTENTIDCLKEYRTRLISDVVTGKLDVQDAVTNLKELESGTKIEAS